MRALLRLIACLLLAAGCVPLEEIEGAPCPCPEGFNCCKTLRACLSDLEQCPSSYPPSSGTPCEADADCPRGEICHAWRLEGGELAGPRECRQDCAEQAPCAEGERCEVVLHDGFDLDLMHTAPACVDEQAISGCEGLNCSSCGLEWIGRPYCAGSDIEACFVSLDPFCGLVCQPVLLFECGIAGCVQSGEGVECGEPVDGPSPCQDYPCDACPEPSDPAKAVCDGDVLVACTSMPWAADDGCDRICMPLRNPCAEDMVCSQEGGAHCAR
ncbi:MAG: hypothetical protein JXR96_06975 [Deltaproteobacteria bacterium]|nr:hypothetical protein [Deltaproteobacteria bacterium]